MSSGERPIGAANGKQPNTEALCQPPPPPPDLTSYNFLSTFGNRDSVGAIGGGDNKTQSVHPSPATFLR